MREGEIECVILKSHKLEEMMNGRWEAMTTDRLEGRKQGKGAC